MSQETYDHLKDQREVRLKHIEEYVDWQYKEEHEIEQERRRRKNRTTESTPCVESASLAENMTPERSVASTLRPRIVERFKERQFSLPIETTAAQESIQTTKKEDISTREIHKQTTESTTSTLRPRIIESFKERHFTLSFETVAQETKQRTEAMTSASETLHQTLSTVTLTRPSICFTTENKSIASTHQPTQTKITQNRVDNTLVEQLLYYKRFSQKTKKTRKRYTISVQNYTRPTTEATNATEYPDYGDYNVSTTLNFIHGHQHEDPLRHLTNIPIQVFDVMKQDEEDLYHRYHNNELSLDMFREMKDRLVSKYLGYAKSTTVYRHPTFNLTVTVFPTFGKIENYDDVWKEWKKAKEFEKKMEPGNDTFLQSAFSIAFTPFPPTIPSHQRRRYRRMAKYSPHTRRMKRVLKNSSFTLVLAANKETKKLMTKNKREQCTTVVTQISSPKCKRKTQAYNAKKEIKAIQKQLFLLREDLENLKLSIRRATTKVVPRETENTEIEYFMNDGTVYSVEGTREKSNTTSPSNFTFERMPFLYAREEKNGK